MAGYIEYAIYNGNTLLANDRVADSCPIKYGDTTKKTITATSNTTLYTAGSFSTAKIKVGNKTLNTDNKYMPNNIIVRATKTSGNREQVFSASTIWRAPYGISQATVFCVGGGGAGGDGGWYDYTESDDSWHASQTHGSGGGGGKTSTTVVTLKGGSTYSIDIGNGGSAPRETGTTAHSGTGGSGGITKFSSLASAAGGTGGKETPSSGTAAGTGGSGGGVGARRLDPEWNENSAHDGGANGSAGGHSMTSDTTAIYTTPDYEVYHTSGYSYSTFYDGTGQNRTTKEFGNNVLNNRTFSGGGGGAGYSRSWGLGGYGGGGRGAVWTSNSANRIAATPGDSGSGGGGGGGHERTSAISRAQDGGKGYCIIKW